MSGPKRLGSAAVAHAKSITSGFSGMCEMFVRTAFGLPAKYASARLARLAVERMHPGDYNAPAGVPVWFDITSGKNAPYDHVAISVGGGYCYSTSVKNGKPGLVKIAALETAWKSPYLGWSEDYHGFTVWSPPVKPAPSPSTPGPSQSTRNAQTLLAQLGFYTGLVDGVHGPKTEAALRAAQKTFGLHVDGIWGPKTDAEIKKRIAAGWKLGGRPAATTYTSVHRGSKKASVIRKVQQALRNKGYNKQIVDGVFGTQTFVNVKDWQRRNGLRRDGIAGAITQKSLGL